MKPIRYSIIAAVAAGMLFTASTSEANVRDPISRKFQAEKGFFTNRSATPSRAPAYQSPRVVSQPTYTTPSATIAAPQVVTPSRSVQQYRGTQPRYIRSR